MYTISSDDEPAELNDIATTGLFSSSVQAHAATAATFYEESIGVKPKGFFPGDRGRTPRSLLFSKELLPSISSSLLSAKEKMRALVPFPSIAQVSRGPTTSEGTIDRPSAAEEAKPTLHCWTAEWSLLTKEAISRSASGIIPSLAVDLTELNL